MKDFYDAYSAWTRSMGYTLTHTQQTVDRNLSHLGFATKKGNQGKMVMVGSSSITILSLLRQTTDRDYTRETRIP